MIDFEFVVITIGLAFVSYGIAQFLALEGREGFPIPVVGWDTTKKRPTIRWSKFGVLLQWRLWMGAGVLGKNGQPATALGRLSSCPVCVQPWVGLVLAAIVWHFLDLSFMQITFAYFGGVIGVAPFLHARGYHA